MAAGDRNDPYRGYNFRVELDGLQVGGFQEVGGLDSSTDPIDYRVGTDPGHVRKLPGLTKLSPLTLKRGMTDSEELWNWRQAVVDGKVLRKNGAVIMLDDTGAEKWRWNFTEAWPSKWTGPAFNATGNAVAVETLEIVHEELKKAAGKSA